MRFQFPDVANFPIDGDEPLVTGDHVEFPPNFLTTDEPTAFINDFAELVGRVYAAASFDPVEEEIFTQHVLRIRSAAHAWYKYGPVHRSEFDLDGIIHRVIDVNALQFSFAKEIDALQNTEEPGTGLTDVDRAITVTDPGRCRVVQTALIHCGVTDAIRQRFANQSIEVKSVTVHVSRPEDRHHYQQFRDQKVTTKLLNMHVDPKPGVMKAIIYLNEVGPDDGPFKAVRGSHRWEVDPIERIFAWGNSTGNYCHTPKHRRVACAFPSRFRRNAIIGRLIPDGTNLSDLLLESETPYTSDVANVIAFDPCFVLHRGGQCVSGERVNLQVVMK